MGQTADILPDPITPSSPSPGTDASIDELLSQLADREINRLLAGGESAGSESALKPFEKAGMQAVQSSEDISARVETTEELIGGTSAASALAQPLDERSNELDDLLANHSATRPHEKAPADVNASTGATGILEVLDPIVARDGAIERPLTAPFNPAAAAHAEVSTGAEKALPTEYDAPTGGPRPGTSRLIKLLDLVTLPFLLVPETWRDAAGKIALLTIVHAALILAWVKFFRRSAGH